MKTIFVYLASTAFNIGTFTYLYMTDNGGLFAWCCALLMIFLTFGMAIIYEPKRYFWFVSFMHLDEEGRTQYGRQLLFKPYKKMTALKVLELEQELKAELNLSNVRLRFFERLAD